MKRIKAKMNETGLIRVKYWQVMIGVFLMAWGIGGIIFWIALIVTGPPK